jgi:hypothetical protein
MFICHNKVMNVYINMESPINTQPVCMGAINFLQLDNRRTLGLWLMDYHAPNSSFYGLSWPSTKYFNKNWILHTTFQNPNKNLGMEMAKRWTSNIYNIFFKSSQKSPNINNLLKAPKHLGIQSFPCILPNYLKHIQFEQEYH